MQHSLTYRWNMWYARKIGWWYWAFRQWLFERGPWCGFGCEWTMPFGFVPEAGCPVHDR